MHIGQGISEGRFGFGMPYQLLCWHMVRVQSLRDENHQAEQS